jgi:hypothetical protein
MYKTFKIEDGVKQGESLLANLFSVVVDIMLKQRDLGGNIFTHLKQCSAYTDDVLITTKTKKSLIDNMKH